jgi:hypothetical protein
MTIQCSECGQFCQPVDRGTFYGNCLDIDPPDEDFFCKKCYNQKVNKAKYSPEEIIINCWWIKPNYVAVTKSIIRHRKKHGHG